MVWDESRGACDPYNKTTCGADKFVDVILADEAASSYVDGIAFHWYSDTHTNTSVLDHLQRTYSKQWILYTEVCFLRGCKLRDIVLSPSVIYAERLPTFLVSTEGTSSDLRCRVTWRLLK
jgi:hypothetical protein